VFYQFNLVRLERLAAAETASPLAFVRRDEFTRNAGVLGGHYRYDERSRPVS